ncbi:GINS complex, Psf1 component [Sphaerulina musiva SO2202]|uniref:DNA replication complex GINS protein PSF1 n=1 Tax=Sphaerulina musiva (strain SO2202) TaxID=692275 RepID=N1QLZ6_SPHMS|nr:GINS complex, Psf1 component [Sphaerulina musiva SO2202]EMF16863.1 GINS complex, Psf1 component [Sphaerulina musiva SO2202]
MYAEQALKLVHDARRTENLPHLPPYNTTVIRAVTKEVRDLDREINTLLAPFAINNTNNSNTARSSTTTTSSFNPHEHPQLACTLLVNQLSMRRNKRCLLAYHRTRTEKLEGFCWEGRDVNINNNQNQNINNNTISETMTTTTTTTSTLSSEEEQYTHAYSSLLAAYKGQWTEIDLTGSVEPPQDIFIDVRVLKDAGEIQTEYGSITLTKNSQFYVRAGDVEGLVRQGYLQKLG